MNSTSQFDYCVFGGGLAGLSIAEKLLERSASVCLIDTGDIASGASGTPLGLVNPATGRFGTKVWEAENCFAGIAQNLERVQAHSEQSFYKKTGVLRPAQDEKMAERMHENVQTQDWPEGWCEWLDKEEVRRINPNLNCIGGGVWLPKALTVDVGSYLNIKVELLKQVGLQVHTNAAYQIKETSAGFEIALKDGSNITAASLVYATGYETSDTPYWSFLPLHSIKGQLALFESPEAAQFDYSISALGYIASISKTRFIAGSTYEHYFDHTNPDEQGKDYLIERLTKVYPALFENAKLVDQWSGVRASSPNRKPYLGRHPEKENVFVFTGLSSKGLLFSDCLGQLLVDHIFEGTTLPKPISVSRI